MNKTLQWAAINILALYFLVAAIGGSKACAIILACVVTFFFFVALYCAYNEVEVAKLREKGPPIPEWLEHTFNVVFAFGLFLASMWVTLGLHIATSILIWGIYYAPKYRQS